MENILLVARMYSFVWKIRIVYFSVKHSYLCNKQCFKWAVTTAVFAAKNYPERITKIMKINSEKFNWDKIEFHVQLDKIYKFAKNNPNYGINVYGYKNEQLYPLRISKNEIIEHTLNLLIISNKKANLYCGIKNISRILSTQVNNNGHQRYYCERCLNSFWNNK